ncbi:MAG: helix-turn-helix domain-containing protein [Spirochaetota bacterium]
MQLRDSSSCTSYLHKQETVMDIAPWIHFGIGLSLLLAFLELLASRRLKRFSWLLPFSCSLALLQWQILVYIQKLYELHPEWLTFAIGNISLLGPILYSHSRHVFAELSEKKAKPLYPHFLLPLFIISTELYFLYLPAGEKLHLLHRSFTGDRLDIINLGMFLVSLRLFAYFVNFLKRFYDWRKDLDIHYPSPLLKLLLFYISLTVLLFLAFLLRSQVLVKMGSVCLVFVPILVFMYRELYPNFFAKVQKEILAKKYEKTQLKGIDVQAVHERIITLMEADKLYHDETLKLASLAKELLLSPNQLSRILNESFQKNFNDFIGEYRIAEAKQLLVQQPDKTVLTIAHEVGFYAKSTFNAKFVQMTGMTPTKYRKQHT